MTTEKINNFTQLNAWEKGHMLVLSVYRFTKTFPENERYGMVSQMRRAANSAAANVAEGFGRQAKSDKIHFYVMARGSITELQSHAQLAHDVGLIDEVQLDSIETQSTIAHKLVVGLIKSIKVRNR